LRGMLIPSATSDSIFIEDNKHRLYKLCAEVCDACQYIWSRNIDCCTTPPCCTQYHLKL
jgi:hypothetical protein